MLNWNYYPGPGPTLILLPAFPFSSEMWNPVVEILKSEYTILSLNYPGFGGSYTSSSHGWTFPLISEEIKKKLDTMKIEKASVCGVSMGGYAALDFSIRYPEYIDSVVLANTQAVADSDEMKENRNKSIQQLLTNTMSHFADGFLGKALDKEKFDETSETREFLKSIIEAQPAAAVINALIAMTARADSTAKLEKIKAPALVITGGNDFVITSARSAEIHEGLNDSRFKVLEEVGHLSPVEAPGEFASAVRKFLNEKVNSKTEGNNIGKELS